MRTFFPLLLMGLLLPVSGFAARILDVTSVNVQPITGALSNIYFAEQSLEEENGIQGSKVWGTVTVTNNGPFTQNTSMRLIVTGTEISGPDGIFRSSIPVAWDFMVAGSSGFSGAWGWNLQAPWSTTLGEEGSLNVTGSSPVPSGASGSSPAYGNYAGNDTISQFRIILFLNFLDVPVGGKATLTIPQNSLHFGNDLSATGTGSVTTLLGASPVPEPSTLGLAGLALGLVWRFRRRSSRCC